MARSCVQPSVWVLACVLIVAVQLRSLGAQDSLQSLRSRLDSTGGLASPSGSLVLHKRPFLNADCRGSYVPRFDGYLSRMHNICKECSDMYPGMRDFIALNCTAECFRNRVFQDCLLATMQLHQLEEIHNMIGQLSGRK
ncbi:hypothetical protein BIW11_01881 [Tropilaelaps mercedesae]|uniref:Uncharacterized protein n=1 Tax=Tropilaelaps mercedesae TaxID=418985 RepID=A0A1V9X6N4_9ACAR|nr:hypothetical protein BIW11_01881 [Tropilaelaps mercedesae]